MSISNTQYNEIMRSYEEKRNKSRHLMDERRNEVYERIPEYKALDSSVASISLKLGRKIIEGDPGALNSLREISPVSGSQAGSDLS